jgi:hypothetical protein
MNYGLANLYTGKKNPYLRRAEITAAVAEKSGFAKPLLYALLGADVARANEWEDELFQQLDGYLKQEAETLRKRQEIEDERKQKEFDMNLMGKTIDAMKGAIEVGTKVFEATGKPEAAAMFVNEFTKRFNLNLPPLIEFGKKGGKHVFKALVGRGKNGEMFVIPGRISEDGILEIQQQNEQGETIFIPFDLKAHGGLVPAEHYDKVFPKHEKPFVETEDVHIGKGLYQKFMFNDKTGKFDIKVGEPFRKDDGRAKADGRRDDDYLKIIRTAQTMAMNQVKAKYGAGNDILQILEAMQRDKGKGLTSFTGKQKEMYNFYLKAYDYYLKALTEQTPGVSMEKVFGGENQGAPTGTGGSIDTRGMGTTETREGAKKHTGGRIQAELGKNNDVIVNGKRYPIIDGTVTIGGKTYRIDR